MKLSFYINLKELRAELEWDRGAQVGVVVQFRVRFLDWQSSNSRTDWKYETEIWLEIVFYSIVQVMLLVDRQQHSFWWENLLGADL